MPMQMAKCPDCNDRIGGREHVMVNTNRRLTDAEVRGGMGGCCMSDYDLCFPQVMGMVNQPETGYLTDMCSTADMSLVSRPGPHGALTSLRILLLAAMNAAAVVQPRHQAAKVLRAAGQVS